MKHTSKTSTRCQKKCTYIKSETQKRATGVQSPPLGKDLTLIPRGVRLQTETEVLIQWVHLAETRRTPVYYKVCRNRPYQVQVGLPRRETPKGEGELSQKAYVHPFPRLSE